MRVDIPYELLDPKPDNARRHFLHLDDLALTIADYGLLQNLVVKEKADGRFQVEAGERRRRAIGLLMLDVPTQIKQCGKALGGWYGAAAVKSGSKDGGVPCFVIPKSADDAAHAIENIQREDLWPWELGRKLASWNDAGYDQEFIGRCIGKSQNYVSLFIVIGQRLSPKVSEAIEKTGDKSLVSKQTLSKICRCYDPVLLEPQHLKQVEMFERLLGATRKITSPSVDRSERHRVHARAKKLGRMKVPGHAKMYVRAIYEFLFDEGHVNSPKFNW